MGNFSISHYTRIEAHPDTVQLRYILDMAEIPTVTEKMALDADRDGSVTEEEKRSYLRRREPELLAGLTLTINHAPAALNIVRSDLSLIPGAGGLDTLKITFDMQAGYPARAESYAVAYQDRNYSERVGWKEIVTIAGNGMTIRETTAAIADQSRELSHYPLDAIPVQMTQATFTAGVGGSGTGIAKSLLPSGSGKGGTTPRDAFTQAITERNLTPGLMLAGLGIAFMFGAFHALSPGHGKAMVAAYLVGARGTLKHAAVLGLVVTFTHTMGVFALGLVTLFASRYIVPERLYSILSVVSGLMVVGVGGWLLYARWRGLEVGHHHRHQYHDHHHDHDHHHHDHDHHDHDHDHHDHHHHHHLPEGPITARGLIALGVSGGIVPCPSALVVLLSAIALNRIGYGMALISAFSAGLAAVLVGIGILVVSAQGLLSRLPSGGGWMRKLPVASALVITMIGMLLVARALAQVAP
jgi:ABC-type nickel/cobalt efflux system permease component RcnA